MDPSLGGCLVGKRQVTGVIGQGTRNHAHNAATLRETAAAYIKRNEQLKTF
jgi:hypothetical protein